MKRYAITITAIMTAVVLSAITASALQKQKGPVVPNEKIALFNGKDFTGWKIFATINDPASPDKVHPINAGTLWSVKDGVIACEGKPWGYIRTETNYADYHLHVEWRWLEPAGNSGIFLHTEPPEQTWPKAIECQLRSGEAGTFICLGSRIDGYTDKWKRIEGTAKLHESSEKPIGQWNACEIICKDDWIVVFVNGVLQNVGTKTSLISGSIGLQAEGGKSEFRNIYIEPLE